MTKFQKIDPLHIDARQARRLRVSADRVETRAEARPPHEDFRRHRANGDEQDEVGNALAGNEPDRQSAAATIARAAMRA